MFNTTITMEQQVNALCRSGYCQLRMIDRIRRNLSNETTSEWTCYIAFGLPYT